MKLRIMGTAIMLISLASSLANAATILVPAEYSTIQLAVDAAVSGDTILVTPGTYGGANLEGKNITVRSDGDGDPATYDIQPHATIIANEQILFLSGETESAVLDGFTMLDCFGCIQFDNFSNPTIKNCIFRESSCSDGCGIQVINGASPTIINSIFYGNSGGEGAAADIQWSSSAKFINSTFYGNIATIGGAIHCENYSSVTLINSIFWRNNAAQGHEIAVEDNSSVTVSYSNVQGGQPEVFVDETSTLNWVAGTNINADPLFVDAANNDFHLQPDSPSIDVGNASDPDLPATDYEGDPRIMGPAPDMGADEWKPQDDDIDIDIKPGNKKNVINPRAKGGIWVAILSDTDPGSSFDPTSQVDITTVELGRDGAKVIRQKVKDINKDGLGDLLLRFKTPETGIACGDTEATLVGDTFDGQSFTGTDSVRTVGCKICSLDRGLVAYYPFDGNANDYSGSGNHGTEIGGISYVDGVLGQAVKLDGVDDYIAIPELLDPSIEALSFSVWAWPEEGRPYGHIIYKGTVKGEVTLELATNKVRFDAKLANGSWYSSESILPYTNNYISLVGNYYRGSHIELWVNGELMASTPIPNYDLYSQHSIDTLSSIGAYNQRLQGITFEGLIDDARIYNRALSEVEIKSLSVKTVGCIPKKCHKKHHDTDRNNDKKHNVKHKEKKYHDRDHDDDHKKR